MNQSGDLLLKTAEALLRSTEDATGATAIDAHYVPNANADDYNALNANADDADGYNAPNADADGAPVKNSERQSPFYAGERRGPYYTGERQSPFYTGERRGPYFCGVDLGTSSIILVVLNGEGAPVACEMQACQVARDGLVVDYMGAVAIVRRLKEKLERRLGAKLENTAIAVPPGTGRANAGVHRHIVEAADMEVVSIVDEPEAANATLRVENGVVVDIGGGTTGLSVVKDGGVIFSADEPTGGIHISLVLMGRYKFNYEQAEAWKQDPANAKDAYAAALPVLEKMAGIVERHIRGRSITEAWLVGGTSCLPGIERVFADILGVPAYKPVSPMLVTPLGIALCCRAALIG